MRVRPLRPTANRSQAERRPHALERPVAAAAPAEPDAPEDPALQAARRHRESVAPEDSAHYGCACGFQFEAPVSTSVACPHCGSGQAW